ncbi:hypothetical protein DOTSEDRAFT_50577 [Dothistroma septosporum NZE10]|uniref:Methyltransferase domain-containing protein n=1 Tax=Dothistroma septosporum (strain NZE10 / CBS 128990) TaxID=675120 RepID=N1PVY8_DOTSN|nr:hypothetical protein DOTSEDRAFT_50577 [Dothistroma septosporum NZE10]
MPSIPRKAQTEGSSTFEPSAFFESWSKEEAQPFLYQNDFRKFIIKAFGLILRDDYPYKATAEVTLLQAQTYIEFGGQNGLHAWYRDAEGQARPSPTASDVAAYTDIFRPTTSTSKALRGLESNAKKDSVRLDVAKHLLLLYAPPAESTKLAVNKSKTHINPYLDVWAWCNQNLEWCGPEERTKDVKISHAVLPILYHHFGCVCPSYEALSYISQVAKGRRVLDVGSGNGYWTYMLRRFETNSKKAVKVLPIDNGQSEWRTMWVGDTLEVDGEKWLKQDGGGNEDVLLLVYPVVGQEFTSKMLKAYTGTTIIAAGTQNVNGFTAFAKETIADWMARELPAWEKALQIPLPSFAGKDEALFIFEKKAGTV